MFADRIDLTKLDETENANLGSGRKFQKPTVFENLSVFENFELAMKAPRGPWRTLMAKLNSEALDRISWALDTVGLGGRVGELAGALSHGRSEEHTSELQSLMRISYAVFCLKKKTTNKHTNASTMKRNTQIRNPL